MLFIEPIGLVHTHFSKEEITRSLNGVNGVIEIYNEFRDGLKAIDEFSHLIVIAFLDRVTKEQRKVLKVRFRRLQKLGISLNKLPEVGVFCSDSPHRPNPIALSIVKLVERKGRMLHIEELDLLDKTPVLDLKPYTPDRVIYKIQLPTWYKKVEKEVIKTTGIQNPKL